MNLSMLNCINIFLITFFSKITLVLSRIFDLCLCLIQVMVKQGLNRRKNQSLKISLKTINIINEETIIHYNKPIHLSLSPR